ncbi:uncharacterized protein LOC119454154 [Dermacentor silvarum]|uniref:uncharacterized protein LOC119454154 n=1 Tax=Dermacentor silvarum TaxID=543639 RepID=UPI0018975013|nr:uncharacterized protein LOC119454154 [Dermacentor silvarum]
MIEIFSRIGLPKEIVSDQGTSFTAELMEEVGRLLAIRFLRTTPYHAMANGLVEKFNGTLKTMLKRMCQDKPRSWDRLCALLGQSLAIVYYLQRKYAHNSELYPECIDQRTRVDQILYSVACSIRPHHITFLHPRFGDNSKPTEEEQADFEKKVLGGIQRLIAQGPFAAGDTLTVAVLSILAFLALSLDIGCVNSFRFPDVIEYCERVKGALSYFDDIYGSTIRLYRRIWAQLQ